MAYGVGYQGIGIYPMGPGGPMIPFPHLKDNDDQDTTTRRVPRQPVVSDTWSRTSERQELEGRLLEALRDPTFHERLSGLAQESDNQWQRVGNPDTWRQAGVTQEDMIGINERALAETERRVRENGTERGEAAYLAQAGELSSWARQHLAGASPERLPALQAMDQGGRAYIQTREEFLQLKTDSGLAGLTQ